MIAGRRGGFSLIEVLVATLLLGVTLAGITEAMTASLRTSKDGEQHTLAVLLAESRMEEIRAEGNYLVGESTGEFGSYPLYEYRENIQEAELDGLFEVTVEVEHVPSKRKLYTLKTLLFELPYDLDSGYEPEPTTGDGIEAGR